MAVYHFQALGGASEVVVHAGGLWLRGTAACLGAAAHRQAATGLLQSAAHRLPFTHPRCECSRPAAHLGFCKAIVSLAVCCVSSEECAIGTQDTRSVAGWLGCPGDRVARDLSERQSGGSGMQDAEDFGAAPSNCHSIMPGGLAHQST